MSEDKDNHELVLDNGLVCRVIRTRDGCATISLDNLTTGQQMVRSVRPEAVVTMDGVEYPVGGLTGQPVHNYLDPAWLKTMKALPGAYEFERTEVGVTKERFPWKKRLEWMPADVPWPPPGKSVTLHFRPPAGKAAVQTNLPAVQVHYEIYDGIPAISKWITVQNTTDKPVRLNKFICEILAVVEGESVVDDAPNWRLPDLYVRPITRSAACRPSGRTVPGCIGCPTPNMPRR